MNYINNISIFGLMNKNCSIGNNPLEFWKTKNKNHLVRCISILENIPNNISKLSYMYLDENPELRGQFVMEQIISKISKNFKEENLSRKENKEIFETYRKYHNKIKVYTDIKQIIEFYDEIIEMIETWRYADYGGMKYMWQERAGVDKSFFKRYIENECLRDNIKVYLFFYNDILVGYSIMPKLYIINEYNIPEFSYMLRKCILKHEQFNLRNITEYIDWYTFNDIMNECNLNEIAINWGCSSGGVKWYKEHKWPLLEKKIKWFVNIKQSNK